jgi:transcriptional regulator with XRE-family HTH domain
MSGSDHQPTSAGVNAVGPELRRLRRERGETQRAVAEAIGVSRANLTQWETGKYLPSPANARALDDYFGAGSTIVTLVSSGHAPTVADAAAGPSLLEVFHRVGASLRDAIGPDAKGRPGWQQNLQQDRPPSVLSTAYGIKAMVVVDEPYVDLDALADSLLKMLDDTEVWNADPESLRPEIVATVVDALFRVGTPMPIEDALLRLEASLDDAADGDPAATRRTARRPAHRRPAGHPAGRPRRAGLAREEGAGPGSRRTVYSAHGTRGGGPPRRAAQPQPGSNRSHRCGRPGHTMAGRPDRT